MSSRPTAAVVLAAGASSRMGRPKALLALDGATLLEAWLARFRDLGHRVVVGGAEVERLRPHLAGARLVVNPDWASTGAIESLAIAVRALPPSVQRVVVTPVDVPPCTPDELSALLSSPAPAVLAHHDQPGHPVLLGVTALQVLRTGPLPKQGLRVLLHDAARISAGPDVLLNLNTPEQWARWRG